MPHQQNPHIALQGYEPVIEHIPPAFNPDFTSKIYQDVPIRLTAAQKENRPPPKYRSMRRIAARRGIYGGAIGYLDFTGNMDTCIAIRIVYRRNNKVFIRSGAGIVADSNPESEYQECINKSAAVINALKNSSGGLDLYSRPA